MQSKARISQGTQRGKRSRRQVAAGVIARCIGFVGQVPGHDGGIVTVAAPRDAVVARHDCPHVLLEALPARSSKPSNSPQAYRTLLCMRHPWAMKAQLCCLEMEACTCTCMQWEPSRACLMAGSSQKSRMDVPFVPCHPLLRPTIRRKIVCQGEAEADAVRVCRRDHLIEPLRMHVISDGSESWEAQDAIPHFKQSTKEGVMHAMLARTLECV